MNSDHKDFYIRNSEHPNFEDNELTEDDAINVIIQKLEMIIFSNKGDLYGDQNFGTDLEYYLWQTKVPSYEIKKKITEQVNTYIPELQQMGYELDIDIYNGTLYDIMYIKYKINGYNFSFVID